MDVDDFASVFALVQRGQVEGLAGDRKTGNTVAGKKELEIKKTQFCDAIKVRRENVSFYPSMQYSRFRAHLNGIKAPSYINICLRYSLWILDLVDNK